MVRNPFDRLYSAYTNRVRTNGVPPDTITKIKHRFRGVKQDTARIVGDNSRINLMGDNSRINLMGDNSRINSMGDNSRFNLTKKSFLVQKFRGKKHPRFFYDS